MTEEVTKEDALSAYIVWVRATSSIQDLWNRYDRAKRSLSIDEQAWLDAQVSGLARNIREGQNN